MKINEIIMEEIDNIMKALLGSDIDEYDEYYKNVYRYEIKTSIQIFESELNMWEECVKLPLRQTIIFQMLFNSFSGIVCDEISSVELLRISRRMLRKMVV